MPDRERDTSGLPPGAADPVFVGGTGRSGTHVMARLLGKHSAYYYFRREMRFHTDRGGYPDLLAGRISADQFVDNMRGRFWRRTGADGLPRGLHDRFPHDVYDAALERFRADYDADARAACRGLMNDLLDPLAREAGKASWIEQTPPTVAAAGTLHEVFPGMKLIHMVRDGRDVACSVIRKEWGPSSVMSGIPWWEERIRVAHAATSRIPDDRFLVVYLEHLVGEERGPRIYRKLLRFLGIEDEPEMRRFFRRRMTPEAASVGRWRRDLSEGDQRRIVRAYWKSVKRLKADGIITAPGFRHAGLDEEVEPESWLGRALPGR